MSSPARRHDEDGLRVLGRHPLGGVLELEPVGEDEVVTLGGVGPERLGLLGWCPGLDVADPNPQRITDPLEALVSRRIPGGIRDRARGDEADPHSGGGRRRAREKCQRKHSIAATADHYVKEWHVGVILVLQDAISSAKLFISTHLAELSTIVGISDGL